MTLISGFACEKKIAKQKSIEGKSNLKANGKAMAWNMPMKYETLIWHEESALISTTSIDDSPNNEHWKWSGIAFYVHQLRRN